MHIVKGYPPNIVEIRRVLPVTPDAIYCYGDTIYNPGGQELAEDVEWHEAVHERQQAQYTAPGIWWMQYLLDPAFRLAQELEAYRAQYAFVREHYPTAAHKEALFDMADALASPMYGLTLTHIAAEIMIRSKHV